MTAPQQWGPPPAGPAWGQPQYPQQQAYAPQGYPQQAYSNPLVSGLLAFFLGSLGAQYFYEGRTVAGVVSLLFSWSGIPSIIGFFGAIGRFGRARRELSGADHTAATVMLAFCWLSLLSVVAFAALGFLGLFAFASVASMR
jgi:TM2 domain-containing membrane protein YozV